MGLFNENEQIYSCKLCNGEFLEKSYQHEFKVCNSCFAILGAHVSSMLKLIPEYQEKANSSSSPVEKIEYLSAMLELLYKYKILYVNNDIHAINQDIDKLIRDVIDAISEAKL